MNPLIDERECMRHSSIPSLLEVIKYNNNRKTLDNFLFEIGRKYLFDSEEQILSIALSGTISSTLWKGEKEVVDFFYLKGIVENLFDKLSIKNYRIGLPSSPLKGLHPGVSASIYLGKDEVGFMGKLHPETMKYFGVSDTFVMEISLEKLYNSSHPLKTIKEISKYPQVVRDLALVMDKSVTSEYLINEIKRASKRTLVDVKVFDLYEGESLGNKKKQLALSLVFQDMTKTLETTEVDQMTENILKHLKELNINLRA